MNRWGSRPPVHGTFTAVVGEDGSWYGTVSEPTGRPGVWNCVWRCRHKHATPDEARDCARDYYQNGPRENDA